MEELTVQVTDSRLLPKIKSAIKLLQGVGTVTTRRKTRLQKAMEEVDNGELFEADGMEDLVKQLHQ